MEQSRNLLVASLIGRGERERERFFLFLGKMEDGKEEQVLLLFDDCFSIETRNRDNQLEEGKE